MPKLIDRAASIVSAFETGKWLWAGLQGTAFLASFTITAWAAKTAAIFSQYAPLSWVLSGFAGMGIWALIRWLSAITRRLRVRALYDEKFLKHGSNINPLDKTFERKRIHINDFVLPSFPFIEGKTFIDCDFIGPANIYFHSSNVANPIRPPKVEAFWLHPTARFATGFTFKDCIFRNCSFQRIAMFASIENYDIWKDNPNVDWIGVPPTPDLIAIRKAIVAGTAPPEAPKDDVAPPNAPAEK